MARENGHRAGPMAVDQAQTCRNWLRFHETGLNAQGTFSGKLEVRNQPLVSACLVHFNNPIHVMHAFSSVIAQTYANIELIIVDDGSINVEALEILKRLELGNFKFPVKIVY
jgi:hypothetical protein